MCTVSWVHQPRGYQLFCNRDEKHTRGIASAPVIHERAGVRYLAPVDADSKGTWIAVNESGMSVCLLNGNPARPGRRSRGLLPSELIWQPSVAESVLTLRQIDLAPFAAFTILLLEPSRQAVVATWDGAALQVDREGDARMPLISSSFDAEGVHRARGERLSQVAAHAAHVDAEALLQFHTTHGVAPNAYSPCMHRSDAQTVSFSSIAVSADEVRFLYVPAAPCEQLPAERCALLRAA